jgi:Bax protein
MPDLSTIADSEKKKKQFFELLLPIIEQENTKIFNDRYFVAYVRNQFNNGDPSTQRTLTQLKKLTATYNVAAPLNSPEFWQELLQRVDVIPTSLVLAQAAMESGWGSSRFAQQGNNLFGHWCFVASCGIVPNDRAEEKDHEVATFRTINKSVSEYLLNLNRHANYTDLRAIRYQLRLNNAAITGIELAKGLAGYSELGHDYIDQVAALIIENDLITHDSSSLFIP